MANETIYDCAGGNDAYVNYVEDGFTLNNYFGVGYNSTYSTHVRGALRFTNLTIPKNSSISSADLHLYAGLRYGSSEVYIKAWAVDEDNSGSGNPFGRTKTSTSNTHNQNISTGGYFSIGVGSIIEEVVARSGWSSGNAIYFIVEDNGTDESSDNYFVDNFNPLPNSYLHVRVDSEPNFKPTPGSVTAPTIPGTGDYGIKISKPGVSVLDATEDETYFTTRKKQLKVVSEAMITADADDVTNGITIPHNLGYIPLMTVYHQQVLTSSPLVLGDWERLPTPNYFSLDNGVAWQDDTNLYIQPALAGETFYYYIFNDQIV